MNDWVEVHHVVAISGRVTERMIEEQETDDQKGKPIGGARITIEAAPLEFTNWLALRAKQYGDRWEQLEERPDRTRTAGDGHFHFMDLPDGDYTLKAELPGSGSRYGTAQQSVVVTRNADGIMAVVDIRLPPTTITGEITDRDTNEKVLMAEVRVKGSGERVFSDAEGRYLLTGLEASEERERTLEVSAQGYQQVLPKNVLLDQAGVKKVVDFVLVPLGS